MKVRTGFVSNSSSSSFCILGIKMNKKIHSILVKLAKEKYKEKGWDIPESWEYEDPSEMADACDLEFYNEEQSDYGEIIGLPIDGKTPEEVVEVSKQMAEIFGDLKFLVMSGEYYS